LLIAWWSWDGKLSRTLYGEQRGTALRSARQ
jgi:hypothetical protein